MPHCYVCNQDKDRSEFHTDNSRILKVMSMCRECNRRSRNRRRSRSKMRREFALLGIKR
jgi:hypothetical protein